jgi:TolB-like protein/DNA-binding winged helix-turn-helix (wHTH) protein/Tfp pilus assembly protein PilF
MLKQEQHFYEFGSFRIGTGERLLRRGEELIPLTPKAVDTLLALISHRGQLIGKDDLLKMVWPDTFVEEGGLARNVSALRKALGEGPDEVRYIETIPKRGYRFVAPVKEVSGAMDPIPSPQPPPVGWTSQWLAWAAAAGLVIMIGLVAYYWIPRPQPAGTGTSLVVLPFKNLSNDPAQEYFADGMTEELINRLDRISALRTISRTSAMIYKGANKPLGQIARELKVDNVVEGSVEWSKNQVRISARLVNAKTEKALWSDSYQSDLPDILNLQSELAGAIARQVQVKLTPEEKLRLTSHRKIDPEAYQAYVNGRYQWNKRSPAGVKLSIGYFERAIKRDSSYAPAYAGLADAYGLLGSIGVDVLPPREAMPKAEAAALKAVELDDSLAEGHTSLAYAKMSYDWDWATAEKEFKRAIELNPGYATAHQWYAHYMLAMGLLDEALIEMERARSVDPYSLVINVGVGWCHYQARRYDRAIDEYRKTLEIDPGFFLAHCTMGMAYEQKGLYKEAIEHYKTGLSLSAGALFASARLAHAYAKSGDRQEAERMLNDLVRMSNQRYVPAVYVASIYEALGDDNHLMEWVEKARQERSDYLIYLRTEPSLDRMRLDPRFIKVLQQVGLER